MDVMLICIPHGHVKLCRTSGELDTMRSQTSMILSCHSSPVNLVKWPGVQHAAIKDRVNDFCCVIVVLDIRSGYH